MEEELKRRGGAETAAGGEVHDGLLGFVDPRSYSLLPGNGLYWVGPCVGSSWASGPTAICIFHKC